MYCILSIPKASTERDKKTRVNDKMATADVDLDDEMVKLVAYSIVSLKPDDERMMPEGAGQIVVARRMSGDDFASWTLAKYVQEQAVDAGELKYLRVYFVVSTRWPREDRKFEERHVSALREIQQAMT